MTPPALQPLEPRCLRSLVSDAGDVVGDVLDLFSNTTGDFVSPVDLAPGLYVANYTDGTSATFIFVPPGDTLSLPIGLTVPVDHLILRGTLTLDHAAVIATDAEIDPAAAVTPAAGEVLTTIANPGPVFRDVPVPAGATVYVATDAGDLNLDGDIDADDVAYGDRHGLPLDDTYAGLMGPTCAGESHAALPVVTHLEVA